MLAPQTGFIFIFAFATVVASTGAGLQYIAPPPRFRRLFITQNPYMEHVKMITENGATLSKTQFYKRIKSILKEDPAMNGSGHLYLHPEQQAPLDEVVVTSIQSHTLEALREQGIDGFDEEKTLDFIAVVLRYISLPRRGAREPGTPPLNKKKKKPKAKQKARQRRRQSHRSRRNRAGKKRGWCGSRSGRPGPSTTPQIYKAQAVTHEHGRWPGGHEAGRAL